MLQQYEEAKKMFYNYDCSTYGMKVDGVYEEYEKYKVPIGLEMTWQREFIDYNIKKLNEEKNLKSLSILTKESSLSTDLSIFAVLYDFYRRERGTDDLMFLAKICSSLVNALNSTSIKKYPDFVNDFIKEITITIEYILKKVNLKDTNSKYNVTSILEENDTLKRIKFIANNAKNNAMAIAEKINKS